MSNHSDPSLSVARVYALAVLTLAEERKIADALLQDLQELVRVAEELGPLRGFFADPLIEPGVGAKTLEKLFRGKLDDLLVDTLQVMLLKGRHGLLRPLTEAYRLALKDRRGQIDVHVSSAVPLSDPFRVELRAWAQKYTGKQPELLETVDASLLGGVVVRIGDEKFDRSVATSLAKLGERLLERASHEIHSEKAYLETSE